MRYQETWIRGPAGLPHQRDCAARYAPIKAFLEQYRRPFSVFDLGANMGYFSFRIATDFPQATVIAVDDKPELPKLAAANDLKNVIVIPKRMTAGDLGRLADCEAFDVVLALNVLHHMGDWIKAAEYVFRLGANAIVETPVPGDANAAHPERHQPLYDMVSRLSNPLAVWQSPSHVTPTGLRRMFPVERWQTKSLLRQTVDAAPGGYKLLSPSDFLPREVRDVPAMGDTAVDLTFETAEISIARPKAGTTEVRNFIPGMNLWNWKLFGGVWPKRGEVEQQIYRELSRMDANDRFHDDLRPWNFIMTQGEIRAIDVGWKTWRTEPEEGGLETCLALLNA